MASLPAAYRVTDNISDDDDDIPNWYEERYFGNYDPVTLEPRGDYTIADVEQEMTFEQRYDNIMDGLVIGRLTDTYTLKQAKTDLDTLLTEIENQLSQNYAEDEDLMDLERMVRENMGLISEELIRRIIREVR